MDQDDLKKLRSFYGSILGQKQVLDNLGGNVVRDQSIIPLEDEFRQLSKEFPSLVPPFNKHDYFSHRTPESRILYSLTAIQSYIAMALARLQTAIEQPLENEKLQTINYDVFLSHSNLDDELAGDIAKLLEANGIHVFATPTSIPTGKWEPQIEQALQTSPVIYVLLTPKALGESIWTHHEFGYFYGYNHGIRYDQEGHNCRYLFIRNTPQPGLYFHVQGTPVDSFDDPVPLAETIAKGIGREFHVPDNWGKKDYSKHDPNIRWI